MGGAFQTSRDVFSNPIWNDVPKFRIFFFIYGNAVFAEEGVRVGSVHLNRGQFLRSYRNLQDDLSYIENRSIKKYSLSLIKRKIDQLVNEERLKIEDTELGTLFTVVNYASYQGLTNYKKHNENAERTATEQYENSDGTEREQRRNNNKNVNKDKKVKKDKENIYLVFDRWLEKEIVKHKKLTDKMSGHINQRIEEHGLEEVLKAIDNFAAILKGDDYYWTHRWTLTEFMKPDNVVRFLDESEPYVTYAKKGGKKVAPSRRSDEADKLAEEYNLPF